jgi:hypothetical protein
MARTLSMSSEVCSLSGLQLVSNARSRLDDLPKGKVDAIPRAFG